MRALLAILAVSLAGCGGGETRPPPATKAGAADANATHHSETLDPNKVANKPVPVHTTSQQDLGNQRK